MDKIYRLLLQGPILKMNGKRSPTLAELMTTTNWLLVAESNNK